MIEKEGVMPAELVEASHGDETFAVRVGWSSEAGHVQVASVTREGRSMWWQVLGYSPPALEQFGAAVRKVVAPNDEGGDDEQMARDILNALDEYSASDGLYVSLDRRGVNRVIRLLRKARDAAFGRDE